MVLPLTRSHDFALDKPGGTRCPHLADDDRCGIHDRLRPEGFPGCVAFDCFGAGQRVTRAATAGHPVDRARLLGILRATQEAVFLLRWAADLPAAGSYADVLVDLVASLEQVADATPDGVPDEVPDEVLGAEVAALRGRAGEVLRAISAAERAPGGEDFAGADLAGADLRGSDLRRADLRGALLVGADLRDADLDRADLLGADLRGADLRGADLGGALFLTRPQVAAADGDARTHLPAGFASPAHWR